MKTIRAFLSIYFLTLIVSMPAQAGIIKTCIDMICGTTDTVGSLARERAMKAQIEREMREAKEMALRMANEEAAAKVARSRAQQAAIETRQKEMAKMMKKRDELTLPPSSTLTESQMQEMLQEYIRRNGDAKMLEEAIKRMKEKMR